MSVLNALAGIAAFIRMCHPWVLAMRREQAETILWFRHQPCSLTLTSCALVRILTDFAPDYYVAFSGLNGRQRG